MAARSDHADPALPEVAYGERTYTRIGAAGIAAGDTDIAAGRLVDAEAVRAWIESMDTDHELPVPFSGR